MKLRACLLLVLAACALTSAHAAVITLGADKDNAILNTNPDNSLGGGPALFTGGDGAGGIHRALLSFDFSGIPRGSTITDVRLTLTLGQVAMNGATTATIGLFGLLQNWGEGTAGSANPGIPMSGQGFAAGPGDATWTDSAYSITAPTLWSTPGGAHASAASATLFLGTNQLDTPFTWLSTPQLLADVQGWVDRPTTNFGWELINANEGAIKSIYGFYSSEWSNAHFGGSPNQVPALQVTYSVPEPSTSALLAAPFLLAGMRKRRRAKTA